jgi:hypothetical protein
MVHEHMFLVIDGRCQGDVIDCHGYITELFWITELFRTFQRNC